MKYIKILGLLAVAAAALMAFAGTASATTVTSPTGTVATPTIHLVNSGGHVIIANPIANISCSSTGEGKVVTHGESVTAEGLISGFTFTGCTNSWHVTTVTPGKFIAHWTSGYNGTLTSSGFKIDTTRLGVTCVYETNNTPIGTLIGGSPAILNVSATISINIAESSGLCNEVPARWEGKYETTSALYLDK